MGKEMPFMLLPGEVKLSLLSRCRRCVCMYEIGTNINNLRIRPCSKVSHTLRRNRQQRTSPLLPAAPSALEVEVEEALATAAAAFAWLW
jgi:hypothetical protein